MYPFKEGDTYYTIKDGEIIESCWDDISEEMYRANPDIKLLKKESVALMYMVQYKNDEQIKILKKWKDK